MLSGLNTVVLKPSLTSGTFSGLSDPPLPVGNPIAIQSIYLRNKHVVPPELPAELCNYIVVVWIVPNKSHCNCM